jgi:hypothetical protein
MQTMKIAGFAAALALATALSAPAFAQTRADTFGGGNRNTASGRFSNAEQSVTTIGGQAIGGGQFGQGGRGGFGGGAVANTFGGHNTNTASGRFSSAVQDVTTIGGVAQAGRGGRGFGGGAVANTFGGGNRNTASGFGSSASQQVTTIGGEAIGGGRGGFGHGGLGGGLVARPGFGPSAVANTFGGGNTNTASGRFSNAQQSVTTIGGQAFGGRR